MLMATMCRIWPIVLLFPITLGAENSPLPPEMPSSPTPTHVNEYRQKMNKYVEEKKAVCQGKSSQTLLPEKKPSPREKKLCFEQLKGDQKDFVNNVYRLRKQYLINLHKDQLKQLEQDRAALLKSLESSRPKRR